MIDYQMKGIFFTKVRVDHPLTEYRVKKKNIYKEVELIKKMTTNVSNN